MGDVGKWIWGGLTTLMGLIGLFVAANATEPVPYWGGLAFFGFAVLFIFLLIKHSYDLADRAHGRH